MKTKPKKTKAIKRDRPRMPAALRVIARLKLKVDEIRERLEMQKWAYDQARARCEKAECEVKSKDAAIEQLHKVVQRLDSEKRLVWENLDKASKELPNMRQLLEFSVKCLDDLENRHLIECHNCGSSEFRFKGMAFATDFKRLVAALAPFRSKNANLKYAPTPGYKLPEDKECGPISN